MQLFALSAGSKVKFTQILMAVWSWCFSEQNLSKFFFVASTQNTACRISAFPGRMPHLGMQENTDGQRQPEIRDMRWKKESRKEKEEELKPRERKEKDKADTVKTQERQRSVLNFSPWKLIRFCILQYDYISNSYIGTSNLQTQHG